MSDPTLPRSRFNNAKSGRAHMTLAGFLCPVLYLTSYFTIHGTCPLTPLPRKVRDGFS
jgi:starvation-inducible outer membrane lipoprotein